MDIMLIIISVILVIVCIVLAYRLFKARQEFKQRLEEVRKQAIEQSRAVLGGKFTEQMAPYLPEFKYDPTEARFIGSPVDLVVFPGLAVGEPTEVVLIEVKAGRSGRLTPRERKIQELIENGMVRWELIHRPPTEEEAEVRE